MMPAPVAAWLGTAIGKACVGFGILAAIASIWFGWLWNHDKKVVTKFVENSKIEGKNINAKNETVRARADRPGAAERVRKNYCRDC